MGFGTDPKLGPMRLPAWTLARRYGSWFRTGDQGNAAMEIAGRDVMQKVMSAIGGQDLEMLYKEGLEKHPENAGDRQRYFVTRFTNIGKPLLSNQSLFTENNGKLMFDMFDRPQNMPATYYTNRLQGGLTMPVGVEEFYINQYINDTNRKIREELK